jgi:hypothetical protein
MEYEDFVVTLRTTLTDARFGNQDAEESAESAAILNAAEPLIAALSAGAISEPVAKAGGAALFDALFTGAVGTLYRSARVRVQERERALRLCLYVKALALTAVPWEYLYDSAAGRFLALHPDSSITRAQTGRAIDPLPVSGELRVLFVVGDPSDAPALDVEAERAALDEIENNLNLSVHEIPATFDALQSALRQPYHILHFTGHGLFDGEQGYLIFKDADGRAERLSGEKKARHPSQRAKEPASRPA